MFDFLFKRKNAKANAAQSHPQGSKQTHAEPKPADKMPAVAQAKPQQQEKKQAALQAAALVAGDEAAALAFILKCEFADARLLAAQQIQSKAALEQVLAAVRNIDRRVAKLMQQRLEALQYLQQTKARAEACVQQAEKLKQDAQLMPNQLSDLDKSWQALGTLPPDLPQIAEFAAIRAALAARLQAQTAWQRRAIDLLAQMRSWQPTAAQTAQQELLGLLQELNNIKQSAEAQALPRHLLPELETQAARINSAMQTIEREQQAHAACLKALADWQSQAQKIAIWKAEQAAQAAASAVQPADVPGSETGDSSPELTQGSGANTQAASDLQADGMAQPSNAAPAANEIKNSVQPGTLDLAAIGKQWQELLQACVPEQRALLQQQFVEWRQSLPQEEKPSGKNFAQASKSRSDVAVAAKLATGNPQTGLATDPIAPRASAQQQAEQEAFTQALDGLQAALQEGSLHHAFEYDKALRDLKNVKPNGKQAARMQMLRAELHHLQSWARWGGKVSREELIKAVEDLAAQNLSVTELAKKVGSMRERWRTLDTSAGPAPRNLWERFDAACTAAYAPAAAHFKKLSAERHENAEKAQELIRQTDSFASTALAVDPPDWRAIAVFCQRVEQMWHKLGTIERKERKRLDKDFAQTMQRLLQPLEVRRAQEAQRREALIAEVEQLNAHERGALDQLRRLQEQWQELAKALPLARKVEQQLWQRFHAGCEQLFAQRKESAHQEQAERRQHLQAKEALCLQLEQAQGEPAALRELLREVKQAWREVGVVPRNQEAALESRFQAAQERLQKQLDQVVRNTQMAQDRVLSDKLGLCQQLETAIYSQQTNQQDWAARWQALPKLNGELEKILTSRWQQALEALDDATARANLVAKLENNQDELKQMVLRWEIVFGIDSPAQFARERLQLQVQVLQSSLKSGDKHGDTKQARAQLCALVAKVDEELAKRIARLLVK